MNVALLLTSVLSNCPRYPLPLIKLSVTRDIYAVINYVILQTFFSQNQTQEFGVDAEAGLPDDDTDETAIIVPETLCQLEQNAMNTFTEFVARLPRNDPWNTEHFLNGIRLLESLLLNELVKQVCLPFEYLMRGVHVFSI